MTAVAARDGAQAEDAGGLCPNCGIVRAGAFCQGCGQAAHIHHNLTGLVHDLAHGVLHFEGTFSATLPLLVRRPGELTWRYVRGERAKFVTPMALFLFSVFLLFAAVNRLALPAAGDAAASAQGARSAAAAAADTRCHLLNLQRQREALLAATPQADTARIDARIASERRDLTVLEAIFPALQTGGHAGRPDGPAATVTGVSWVDHQVAAFNSNRALYAYKLKMASYKYSWALIPISVPFIWLLFCWKRDIGLYHHAIFAIHSLSFMTLLVVGLIGLHFLRVPSGLLILVALLTPPLHLFRHLKGAYRLGRLGALWRTGVMLLFTLFTSSLFGLWLVWLETD